MNNKVSLKQFRVEKVKKFGDIEVYNILLDGFLDNWKKVTTIVTDELSAYSRLVKEYPEYEIDTMALLIKVLPYMTNLDFEDMEYEEVKDILFNGSRDLTMAIEEVSNILTNEVIPQINRMMEEIMKEQEEKEEKVKLSGLKKRKTKDELLEELAEIERKRKELEKEIEE